MYDLIVCYKNENGVKINRKYPRLFDFANEIEGNGLDAPMLDYADVTATFFEKRTEHFDTVNDLYEHCMEIMK